MKRLIGAVMAVALLVSVAPVLAGDSFQALSRLPADLTPLDNAQLATVEGGFGFNLDIDLDEVNLAVVLQSAANVNYGNASKGGEIEQEIEQNAVVIQNID
jgi:hypothetical protein